MQEYQPSLLFFSSSDQREETPDRGAAPDSGAEEVKLRFRNEPRAVLCKLVPSGTSRVHFSASPDCGSSSCLRLDGQWRKMRRFTIRESGQHADT